MKLVTLGIILTLCAQGAEYTVQDKLQFQTAINTAVPGDVINLLPGTYDRVDGILDATNNTGSQQVIIRGTAQSILRCSPVCFVEQMKSLRFENLKIDGFLNGSGWEHISFINTIHDDSAMIGLPTNGLLIKCGVVSARVNPDDIVTGCKHVLFDGANFTQWAGAQDMALDFIAGENIIVRNSTAHVLGRGMIQLKGDTIDIVIENNRILNGGTINGSRALQVGGGADPQFFRRPLTDQIPAASNAIVRNNYVLGGSACMAFVDAKNVVFENNTCVAQTSFVYRILHENPGAQSATDNILRNNAIIDFGGAVPLNISIGNTGLPQFTIIDNLYKNSPVIDWGSASVTAEITNNTVVVSDEGVITSPVELIGQYGRILEESPVLTQDGLFIVNITAVNDGIFMSREAAIAAIKNAIEFAEFIIDENGLSVVREDGVIVRIAYDGTVNPSELEVQ